MEFDEHSFRHASDIFRNDEFAPFYGQLVEVIQGVSDEDLIARHESYGDPDEERTPKSLSKAINALLKERLIDSGWHTESNIFQNRDYTGDTWRLDFASELLSVEVAFNHSTVIAWNLIKPVLASELNHVDKAIQTRGGVIIAAKQEMKIAGGFDSAVGTFEKFLHHLDPLRNLLTVPIMLIGLNAPRTFEIEHFQFARRKKIGRVVRK